MTCRYCKADIPRDKGSWAIETGTRRGRDYCTRDCAALDVAR